MPKGTNGMTGAGFFSEMIKSISVWVAASEEEILGIVVFLGNNSTVSVISSSLVLEM